MFNEENWDLSIERGVIVGSDPRRLSSLGNVPSRGKGLIDLNFGGTSIFVLIEGSGGISKDHNGWWQLTESGRLLWPFLWGGRHRRRWHRASLASVYPLTHYSHNNIKWSWLNGLRWNGFKKTPANHSKTFQPFSEVADEGGSLSGEINHLQVGDSYFTWIMPRCNLKNENRSFNDQCISSLIRPHIFMILHQCSAWGILIVIWPRIFLDLLDQPNLILLEVTQL